MWKLKFNLKVYLSTAALPGQTTKTALTEEFMFQNVAYRPTVYITGIKSVKKPGKRKKGQKFTIEKVICFS
jgi:hypothetical protein